MKAITYKNNTDIVFTHKGTTLSTRLYDYKITSAFKNNSFDDEFEKFYSSLKDDFVMIPVFIFGCRDLFIPIRGDVYAKKVISELTTDDSKEWIRNHTINPYYKTEEENVKILLMSKKPKDSPMMLGVNTEVWPIDNYLFNLDVIRRETLNILIPIYVMSKAIDELNELQIKDNGSQGDETIFSIEKLPWTETELYSFECLEDLLLNKTNKNLVLDVENFEQYPLSSIENMIYSPLPKKYLIPEALSSTLTGINSFYATNNPSIDLKNIKLPKTHLIYVKIKGLPIYQCMTIEAFNLLRSLEDVCVTFSKVDDSRIFDNIYYGREFSASNIEDILKLSILLCIDMDIGNKNIQNSTIQDMLLKENIDYSKDDKSLYDKYNELLTSIETKPLYDAITIGVSQMGTIAEATLTQKELGIFPFEHAFSRYNNDFRYSNRQRNNFCLLNLITEIASLQLSMGREKIYNNRNNTIDYYG